MTTFVYIKTDIPIEKNNVIINANEIGILEENKGDSAIIFFITCGISVNLRREHYETFDISRVGDGFEKKVCNVCHRLLPTTSFPRNQNGVNNRIIRRPSCDDCREIIDGANVNAAERREWTRSKPNLVPFTCPICKKTTIPGLTSKIVLDHDHDTGKIRGWICDSCNTGIGRFKDSIELLEVAIEYLKANLEKQ